MTTSRGRGRSRTEPSHSDRRDMSGTFGALMAVEAASFVTAGLLHTGLRIPLGFAVLDEPVRPYAVIVEGVAVLVLALTVSLIRGCSQSGLGRPGSSPVQLR